jgi:hypothetical protein
VVTIATVALLVLGAAPAFAHTAHITGELTCDAQGRQLVTWFNRGGSNKWGVTTITSSNRAAVPVGQQIPAETVVQVGTETFPANATGNITLRESWRWNDGATDTDHFTITLGIDCNHTTTTPPPTSTTQPPTTTTPPPTTTTPPPTTTTPPSGTSSSTTSSSTTTGPPGATSGSTTPGTPFTGMSSTPLIAFGILTVLGLAALAIGRRKVDEA